MDDIAREKKVFTPSSGFNLVGVDTFEDPGEQLYLIKHFTDRGEAETALKKRKSESEDEALHIYGSEEPIAKSEDSTDAIDALLEKAGSRGGKYYKRVETGNPKRPYKYYYTKAAYDKAHGKKASAPKAKGGGQFGPHESTAVQQAKKWLETHSGGQPQTLSRVNQHLRSRDYDTLASMHVISSKVADQAEKEVSVSREKTEADKKVSEKRSGVWQVEQAPGAEFRSEELAREAAGKTQAQAYTMALSQNTSATGDALMEYVLNAKFANNMPQTMAEEKWIKKRQVARQKQLKAKQEVKSAIDNWYKKESSKMPRIVRYNDLIRIEQFAKEEQFDPLVDKGIISEALGDRAAGGEYRRSRKSEVVMDAIDNLAKAAKPAPKKTPHPVSEAQRRWAFAAEERGQLPKGKAREWSRRVKGETLPASKATMEMLADVIDVGMVGKATDPPEKKETPDQSKDKKDAKPAFGKDNDAKGKDSKGQPPNGKPPQPGDKVEYPTKVEDPENPGEFTFEMVPEGERSEEARFVVSDETPQGAHWEEPQHSEHYEHFKQWKSARKQGLEGTAIPEELVQGAMQHAGKHHFDAGPHKAAYDDHLAHQNANGAPKPPPSHHTVKNNNGSHQAMRSKDEKGKDKPNGKPPMKSNSKSDEKPGDKPKEKFMVAKMAVPRSVPDTEAKDIRTYGRARSGTERPAVGDRSAEIVDAYQELYGYRRDTCKSGDAIEQLDSLSKAGPFIGPKGGKWADAKHTIPWKESGLKRDGYAPEPKEAKRVQKKYDAAIDAANDHHQKAKEAIGKMETGKGMNAVAAFHYNEKEKSLQRAKSILPRIGWPASHIKFEGKKLDGAIEGAMHDMNRYRGTLPKEKLKEFIESTGWTTAKKSEEGKPMHKQTGENYDLSKGMYSYDDRDGKAKDLPEAYLYDYLCGFIKEAIDSYDCRSKMKVLTAGEDIHQRAAQEVMFHLVQRMPKDKNLMRATKKYKVTQDGIANIIKEKNFIATPSDSKPSNRDYDPSGTYFSTDWDSMSAMGATEGNSPTGEVMVSSQESPWAQGSPGVKLADEPDRQPVQIEPGNPFGDIGELQKSKVNAPYQDQVVQPNMDNSCIVHGTRDLTKDQNFQNPHGTCTCKK